jgi:hypothetical protein
MKRHAQWKGIGSSLLLSAAGACGDDGERARLTIEAGAAHADLDGGAVGQHVGAGSRVDAGEGCTTFVSDSLIQHACFHELMGPYAERSAGASASATDIDLDRAHTSFRVALPPRLEGGYGGFVRYQARFNGGYAIFAREARVRVSAQGTLVAAAMTHATEVCSVLPTVSVYSLSPQTYALEVTSDVPSVVLVIEYMDEGTVADAYRVECDAVPRPSRDAAVFVLDAGSRDASLGRANDASAPMSDVGDALQHDASSVPDSSAHDAGNVVDARVCRVDAVLEHACLHAMHGPFEPLTAGTGSAVGPDIGRPHTAWQMTLPSAEPGRYVYRPSMTGEYVYYLDRPLPLALRAQGAVLTPSYVEPVSTCNGITEARVYSLTGGVRYDVEVGPTSEERATLIIESVLALRPGGWSDRFEACP